jgi:hypothetical protein
MRSAVWVCAIQRRTRPYMLVLLRCSFMHTGSCPTPFCSFLAHAGGGGQLMWHDQAVGCYMAFSEGTRVLGTP